MRTLILYFVASHILSFLCSVLEAVLLSTSSSYISVIKKQKAKAAQILENLKEHINRPLASILTINTAAHTIGAAGIGAQVVEVFDESWLIPSSIFITLTMLYLTEMIPKTIGAVYWKKLAPISAYLIQGMIYITYPFVLTFQMVGNLIGKGKEVTKITEDEIRVILEEGTQSGAIEAIEQAMVESIFRLSDRRVNLLMIPRVDIQWLDIHESPKEMAKKIKTSRHPSYPVCDGNLDKVLGIVFIKDLLPQALVKDQVDLKKILRPPFFIPENMKVFQLLETFNKSAEKIALVTDEYGNIEGLVTLYDVLISILGDIPTDEKTIIKRKDGSYVIDGMLPIDEFKAEFDIEEMPEEEKGDYRTLAGFCMMQMGAIPNAGDSFRWQQFEFKIIKMAKHRIEKILVITHSI